MNSRTAFFWGMWAASAIEVVATAADYFGLPEKTPFPFTLSANVMLISSMAGVYSYSRSSRTGNLGRLPNGKQNHPK